jgi:LysM repeat protein
MFSSTMRWRRGAPVAAVAVAVVLAGCGSSDGAGSPGATTVTINPTSYATIAPAITTTTLAAAEPNPGDTVEVEQTYTVVFGDYLIGIAKKFGVEATEVASYNEWPEGLNHPLNPGDIVRIPPGGKVPGESGESDTPTTDSDGTPTSTPSAAQTTTTLAGGACPPGEYEITAEDTTRIAVANKFDITVEELDAANAGTVGYSAFYPGLKIVIPVKSC